MMTELPNNEAKNTVEKPTITSGCNSRGISPNTPVRFPTVKKKHIMVTNTLKMWLLRTILTTFLTICYNIPLKVPFLYFLHFWGYNLNKIAIYMEGSHQGEFHC